MVHEEGILGATGHMAQDEALDEPGGGGPTWVEVRSLAALFCLQTLVTAISSPLGLLLLLLLLSRFSPV